MFNLLRRRPAALEVSRPVHRERISAGCSTGDGCEVKSETNCSKHYHTATTFIARGFTRHQEVFDPTAPTPDQEDKIRTALARHIKDEASGQHFILDLPVRPEERLAMYWTIKHKMIAETKQAATANL